MENPLNTESNQSFESAILALEDIVKRLEDGNETLDDTLKLYEEGIRLYRYCNNQIEKAEQKITVLQNNVELPFSTDLGDELV